MLFNFGWVEAGSLAGMGFPDPDAWPLLVEQGVRAVVSLTEEPPPGDPRAAGLETLHVPVRDFDVPTDRQLERVIAWMRERIDASRPVVVHCHAGRGRTGTILAVYLVDRGLDAATAVARVRAARPGSIETRAQVALVERYAQQRAAGKSREES